MYLTIPVGSASTRTCRNRYALAAMVSSFLCMTITGISDIYGRNQRNLTYASDVGG